MSTESVRTPTPLAAATAGIRKMVLASQRGGEYGEGCSVCGNCETPNSWCHCEQLARAALKGLRDAYYDVRESR